jgi:hypothetical protein
MNPRNILSGQTPINWWSDQNKLLIALEGLCWLGMNILPTNINGLF